MAKIYSEDQVNTTTNSDQNDPAVAALTGGGYVVVWTSLAQDAAGSYGIYAQRYTASGIPTGPEFRVNSTTAGNQLDSSVVGLSDGGFLVTWTDQSGTDGSSYGVYAQRYNASGVAQGSEFRVNSYINADQGTPSVAAYTGGFVVTWYSNGQDGSGYGVYAQRYSNAGAALGPEFRVNTTTSGSQTEPDIAANADGSFVVVWTDQSGTDGSSYGVYAQRYDSGGVAAGSQFKVNTFVTGAQYEPAVTTLVGGGFVVVWRSDSQDGSSAGVYGQRYDAGGNALGSEFRVNVATAGGQYQPDVTALANGGFVVTWYNDNTTDSGVSYADVYTREYAADGSAATGDVKANTPTPSAYYQYEPAIAHLGSDNYVVVWRSDSQDGSGSGVYQQLFGTAAELPRQGDPYLADFSGTLTFGENLVNATPQVIDTAVSFIDPDSSDFAGGRVELAFIQSGSAEDQLGVRNQGTGAGQIGVSGSNVTFNDGSGAQVIGTISGGSNGAALIVNLNASATVDAVEQLIQNLTYANSSGSPQASRTVALRVYDGDGGASEPGVVTINVTREVDGTPTAYGEEQVNTYTPNHQQWPSAAKLTDGSYVVTWVSTGQDGSGDGVYAQRYANNGEALGPEFRVNSLTGGAQDWPQITGLTTGDYVITWQDVGNDGSGYGVYGQRYNASGVAQGVQFQIHTATSGTQYHDNIAAYSSGFTGVWSTSSDIYLQRFDNTGTKIGPETLVSTVVGGGTAQSGSQYVPDAATLGNGSVVIVWTDSGSNDGSGYGVYGRIYNPVANTFGSSFLVNTTTTGNQSQTPNGEYVPTVAALSDGTFVVVWPSDSNDPSGWAVMAQRFDASGNKLGGEFQVNEQTNGSQYISDVTALSSGGFVVSWYNDNYDITSTGSTSDVYIREYTNAGVAVDGERKVNSSTSSTETQPSVVDLGQGNFSVIWSGNNHEAESPNTYGIFQQLFGDTGELARSASPTLADFVGTVTFAENAVNAGLQVIDAAVGLSDPDSGNFNGGRLDLYYTQNGGAEDQLGVVHQGNGAGQIGVSGSTVSYGGTAIGTISGGTNGANLVISFTSNAATVEAVEALIQRLGYSNADSSPNPSRTLGLRVSDGDGGSSNTNSLTINITQDLDGTPTAYGEEQVNTYTPNYQQWPSAAKLTDGSYVVTWVSTGQDGSGDGVYAQRYANNGEAIGAEFRVNSLTGGAQDWPQITGLTTGDYVITWQDVGNDGSGYGVYGQRYNASGVAQGAQFQIHTATSGTQYHDNVAAYASGFTGVWSNGSDIYLQRFDNTGTKIGPETLVSTVVAGGTAQSGAQYVPDAATLGNGSVVVVWTDSSGNDGSGYGVYGRIYNPVANTFGSSFLVNTTTSGNQSQTPNGDYVPTVAALSDGTFVVVWPSDSNDPSGWAVMAQRFDASGNKLGGEFQVNEQTNGSQYISDVTALSSGGFVVSWYNDNYDISGAGSTSDVYIREYTNAGVAVDGERKVNSNTSSTEFEPSVVDLGQGNFSVIWSGLNHEAESPNTYGIYQQLFGDTTELARSASPTLADFIGTVTFAENAVNGGLQVIDAAVGLSDPDSGNFNGGRLDLYYTQNGGAEDQLGVVHQGTGAGQIGVSGSTVSYGGAAIGTISGGVNGANLVINFTSNAATVEAVEALIQRLGYANPDSSPNPSRTLGLRVSDGDGGSSNTNSLTINITQDLDGTPTAYGEEQVNTYTPSHEDAPAIATLSGGGYVVTWVSPSQDGASDGVYAQRFTASGVAVGPEFRVNTSTTGSQNEPTVAGLSDGGFVVVWTDTNGLDGNSYGVYSQRYDAAGVALGGEALVNTFTAGTQYQPSVASYGGGYVVSWTSNGNVGGSGYDVYTQRFNNLGVKVGPEGRVNTTVSSTQADSDVAARADGSHVVVWVDQGGADGNSYGVYAQRHDTAGNKLGAETLVNTETAGAQYEATVAMLSDNGFVVVWRSDNQDGSSAGVYGQRFDSAGTKVGGEFLVNETTNGGQYQPDVTGLSTGGFVVTWYNDNYDLSGTGTSSDVYIREYDAAGNAVDGQRKLESASNSTEYQPVITDLGNGNYAVAYVDYATSASGGNNTYDVVQQIFGNGAEMPRQASPVLGDLLVQRNFSYTLASPYYAGNPQVIDTDVAVSDSDSANFAGGSLIVEFLDGTAVSHANETVAVRNQGTGAGQIGVSGSDVSYGGVTIGTFSGGTAGTNLVVSLNASADAAATRALVENITYVNTVPGASQTDRYIGFRLFDGDGGASQSSDVLVRIQATVTPTTVDLQDVAPLVTLGETQAQAGVVLDSAVQLVYSGANSFNGGSLTVSYVSSTGRAEDQLSIRHEGNAAGQVGVSGSNVSVGGTVIGTINAADTGANGDQLVINFNANATDQAIERVIENLSYQTTSDGPNASRTISIVVRDSASTASTASQVVINVTPEIDGAVKLFGERQVNTFEANEQHVPVVAGLQGANDGSYVVVWRSYTQDGDSYGIYGQRYDAKGAAVGAEFQVNSNTLGAQVEPEVTSLANGGYVVVWTDQSGLDGSSYGVYAQIYNASGAKVGGQFLASTTTTSTQYEPSVVGLSDGSFVVAYRSDYKDATYLSGDNALARRFDASGNPLTAEFTLNSTTSGTQYNPRLAALGGGQFVALYGDASGNDGSSYGVFAKLFNADGSVAAVEQVATATVSGQQSGHDVAALSGGGYVAVWWSADNHIHGQRFNAAGAKAGGEFQVSTVDTAASNNFARVTALDSGGFVVAWDVNGGAGGSAQDIFVQQFDAAGTKIDGPTLVNSTIASTQYYADIAGLSGSNFVVTWAGYNQESNTANTYGIFSQIMGTAGSITRSAAPELVDVVSSVTFGENLVNATPQLIDSAVKLTDTDSASFNGGQLVVASIPAGQNQADHPFNQDQIAIQNEGNGAGQVGVSGSNVSYGGTVIGTIASNGANGANLVVNLNANATAQAVEAVIEHLTYANPSTDPASTRLISIQVSDGAGGASAPRTVQINVTPEVDGAVKLFGERQVNTYEADEQHVPVVAGLQGANDGGYVVVWRSNAQDGASYGIYGQRYDAKGAAVGAEFQVNSNTLGAQAEPEVTSLANGGYVVVWTDQSGLDGSSYGVYAQIYNASGAKVGGQFLANTSATSNQYEPAVVGLSDGSFVVAYRSDYSNASSSYVYDVLAKRYDASGNLLTAEFTLNSTTTGTQYNPRLAALGGGQFVALYGDASGNDGDGYGVFAKLFNADGSVAAVEQVATATVSGQQSGHDVAALSGGGYVAVWWSADNHIHGQRFNAAGAKAGGEFQVSTVDTAASNNFARVTALDSGGFVVAWDVNGGAGGSAQDIFVQQFDAAGTKIDGPTLVNSTIASTQYYADIAGLSGSNFVVTWAGYNQESNTASTYGIFSQIMGTAGSITRSAAPELVDVVSSVTFGENLVNATPQLIDSAVRLSDSDSANFNGGQLVVSVISGYGSIEQAQLPQNPELQDVFAIRHQGSGAGQVGISGSTVSYGGTAIGSITSDGSNGHDLIITFNANATAVAIEAVIENLTYANTYSNPVPSRTVSIQVSDGAGGASVPSVVEINVTPEYDGAQALYEEEVVNTYTPDQQYAPAMARLADGGYVTVWQSAGQDGWGFGIYGQRYNAQGVAVGNQFQVNDYTPNDQVTPVVSSLAGGGFVVVWSDQDGRDGSGYGLFGQRYDANGLQVGNDFIVNTTTTSNQYQPTMVSVPGGGFIVAWYSDGSKDGRSADVFFQRFDNNGSPQGAETRANSSTGFESSAQYEPSIALLNDGSFVVTWRSDSQDGSNAGVFGQRFAANGTTLGSEFRINTFTENHQYEPSIAALTGGGFVVSWTSYFQDGGSSTGVFAQRYANDGTPLGSEFRVNTTTASSEQQPSVTALANGGFVVAWSNGSQIYAQQYNAAGVAVDGEIRVDVQDNSSAVEPVVLGLNNGNFVISWQDFRDDASANTYGIFQRLFGNPADFSRQTAPLIVDLASSVTFVENDVNLTPQVIDAGIGLFDPDSANFDGGRLEVDYISGYGGQDQLGFQGLENQDQLGIRSEGNGPTQVSVSGLNVFYSGVQIGTITANGANHGKLVVVFNANATVEGVESVIENLTYQNTASNPFTSRTVSVRLTDGDGGASDAHFITLNVTPSVDGAVATGLERTVNTTVAGNQVEPSIAHLSDGGYVVVWTDQGGADTSSYGVYGQRYDADNNAVGSEFKVNTFVTGMQYEPQVVGLTGGGFVVVWRSDNQDGSSAGVYAQRYNASGVAQGGEFRVNESTPGGQYQPDVAALNNGGFAVTWYNDNFDASGTGSYGDIYIREYTAAGVATTGQIKANTPTASPTYQYEPAIAVLGDGSFVVTWRSDGQDGSSAGVYAQHFNASGGALGSEFKVNTTISSDQFNPDVAALKDGGYIVTWTSTSQDLSGYGVFAQRYDAAGAPVGTEFRVNTTTSSNQHDSAVTALENGGWVVTWTDDSGSDGSGSGVFMQQYDSAGRQLDGQTRVNSYTYSTQNQPTVASMADGGFVVAYSSYVSSGDGNGDGLPDGGNNTQEIHLQRYSNTAPVLSDVSVNGQEDASLVLTAALFISGFNDPEGQNLAAIKITTLPASGTVKLDGVAIVPGQEISLADLQANKLTYQGNLNFFGLDQFAWTGSDGVSFASTPVHTNINLANVNDAPGLGVGADGTASEGSFFTHALTLGNPDPDTVQVTVNWGDGSANSVYNTSQSLLNIGHTYADNGVYTVSVTANDSQGQANSVENGSFQMTVSNVAPDLGLSGNTSVEQNQVYTLTLGNVFDPGTDTVSEYRIDWGDGSGIQTILAGSLPGNRQVTHSYTGVGPKTIGVSLVDEDGTFNTVETKAITVSAPAEVLTVDAGADRTVNEGSFFVQTINFTDPTDAGTAGRLYTVDWGDGSTSSGRTFNASSLDVGHTYADGNANYTVSVTLDDDGAQQGSDSFAVTVNNVAPTLNLGGNATTPEGSLYTLNIGRSDPGADTVTSYSVDWGDGSAATVLTAAQLAAQSGNVTHTYLDGNANRTITVQATDEDGTWSNTKAVTVNDVAPSIALSGNATVNEGSTYTLTLGAVTDPGQDTASSYTIDWGDGNAEVVTSLGNYNHVYADGSANRTISVVVTDEEGAHANAGSLNVTVNNVAPTLNLTGNATTPEGSVYTLNIGHSDPGADTLSSYTINWGDGSANTVVSAAQLASQSGNVTHSFADGAANFTISVQATDEDGTWSNTKAITVNNVAPTAAVTGADSVSEGSVYTLNVGAVVEPGADTRTGYSIDWGDGSTQALTVAQWAAAAGSFTHTYADGGNGGTARNIVVQATDEDGTFTLGSKALTVNNAAPSLALSGNAATNEGATYVLHIEGSDAAGGADPLSYDIDWGDGSAVQTLTATQLAALSGNVSHIYADDQDGTINATLRTISVTANDGDGGSTNQTQGVTVNNVAPTVALSGAAAVEVGQSYTLNLGAVTDPGTDTVSSYLINWGDGNSQTVNTGGNVSHTYGSTGNYTIGVSLSDEDGTFANPTTVAVAVNAATATLSLEAGANAALDEGATFSRNLSFSDGEDNGAAGWTYSIDYGDGTVVNGSTLVKNLDLNHVYGDGDATRTVTVSLTDAAGETASDSFQVQVNNVAPTAVVTGAASVSEGSVYTLNVGAVVEPGADTRTGYSIDWGDGSTQALTPSQWAAAAGVFTHTYADGGNGGTARNIVVQATDEDGTFTLGSKALTVNNAAPSLALSGNAATNEGAAYVLHIEGSDAAGGADPLSYDIDWGDGSAVQTLTATQLAALSGNVSHIYADDQDGTINATLRTISVTANDGDGGSTNQTQGVTVNNVAPTAVVTGAASVSEGSVYTLNVGAVVEPGADTRTGYSIDWGDGSTQALTPSQWAAAAGVFTHTYADGGNGGTARNIVVQATDEDGTFTLGSKALTVNNAAPSLALSGNAATNEGATYVLHIEGSDAAGGADPLSYDIDWGDGSAVQTLTATQLAALSGNVSHIYADDQDGTINATLRTISVTANDGDGGSTNQTQGVTVNNVAPTVALSGAAAVEVGQSYTLNLGAVTDPGTDTVSSYLINWGDGNSQTVNTGGNVSHTYGSTGNYTIGVSLSDEDGTFANPTTVAVAVNAATATLSLEAGANAALDEGATFSRNLSFSDGEDNGAAGWTYSIDYGDGTVVNGSTLVKNLDLNHVYGDGDATRTVTVSLTDVAGETASDSFQVQVNNVAPTAAVTGADSVSEGSVYTLNVGAVVEPGADTRTGYSIDWGDGSTQALTVAQWAAAAGSFTHTYADGGNGGTARNIVVQATDEDGTFTLGSKALTVNNAAPSLILSGNANTNEGASYVLHIEGSDAGGAADPLSYDIDWGDGSAVQTLTAAQLAALSGNVGHVYADDQDGATNATPRTISVTANDGDGGSTNQTQGVTVNNVAPTVALSGAAAVEVGQSYTLNLGAVTDPGTDTVSSYLINWGDGNSQTVNTGGNVSHTYGSTGNYTIGVSLSDEDGTFANPTTVAVAVNAATATLSLEAGANAALDEGATFSRNLSFSDGEDNGAAGWTYSIDYGDGTVVNGSTLVKNLDLNHVYGDGDATRTVTVSLTDAAGETASDSFQVQVNNVAPTAVVTGAASVSEGSVYTLNVGAVVEPGADTRTGYSIDWGDGSTQALTPSQWAAAAGVFTHTYADGGNGGTARNIVVQATDEDGTFTLGSKALTVNNAAPSLALSGNAATNEGAAYVLHIEGSDAAGGADPLSYDIDWGDGGGVQNLTAAQLAALSGNVGHVFADGNANRTISVTVNDGDGGSTNQTLDVAVSNVAPTLVVSGAANGQVGQNYALNLGAITDPGTDTVVSYQINWGDGNSETVLSGGNVNHVYGGVGNYAIQVGLTDEDGSHANAGSLNVEIDPSLVRIGQAPDRQTGTGGQWAAAWNHADVTVVHKANATSVLEDWTTVRFSGLSPQLLSGGDIYSGDLGVSGQSLATSSVRQEIDGREVLRFNLDGEADAVTVNLSRFFIQDDGSLFAEAGRLRLLDANGAVVGEAVFHANAASGNKQVTLTGQEHFVAVELNAGVYDGSDFVFGGYANANGSFATGPTTDALGGRHGSDFLVDSVEFNFVAVGVPQQDQNLI